MLKLHTFGSIARMATVAAIACGIAGSCATAQQPYFSAQTSDHRVEFFLTEQTARSGFASFCEGNSREHCDAFEKYRITVVFEEANFSLTFVHESVGAVPLQEVRYGSVICSYTQRGRVCASGRHSY